VGGAVQQKDDHTGSRVVALLDGHTAGDGLKVVQPGLGVDRGVRDAIRDPRIPCTAIARDRDADSRHPKRSAEDMLESVQK
jgi:hypothetical protein